MLEAHVELQCRICGHYIVVLPGDTSYRCRHCKGATSIRKCEQCASPCRTRGKGVFKCIHCSHVTKFPRFGSGPELATASMLYDFEAGEGLYPETTEEERQTYSIACAHCKHICFVPGFYPGFACTKCEKTTSLLLCAKCGSTDAIKDESWTTMWNCRWCRQANWRSSSMDSGGRVLAFVHEAEKRGLHDKDPQRVWLVDFTVISAFGHELARGVSCSLVLRGDGLIVSPEAKGCSTLQYDHADLLDIEIGGPGIVTSGGGFRGGGFGVVGAAEGAAIAGVLNAMTTKTKINNVVRIVTRSSGYLFHNATYSPSMLAGSFEMLTSRILQARLTQQTQVNQTIPELDPVEQLTKLAELRQAGVVSEEEFAAAKSKILQRLG